MARVARRDAPGAVHHVLLRGIERRRIFLGTLDRENFLERLERLLPQTGAACFAWALLPNHVHLVLRTGVRPLSELMHRLNTGYARGFNLRHGRSGYLFQNRFRSIPVKDDAYLQVLIRYVHRNPLEAGLVESLEALGTYPWCGLGALLGQVPRRFEAVEEVLARFGRESSEARRTLLAWMAEPDGGGVRLPQPTLTVARGAKAGEPAGPPPVDSPGEELDEALREVQARRRRAAGWTVESLVDWVCAELGVDADRVRAGARRREESRARSIAGWLALRELGCTLGDVSRATGVTPPPMNRALERGRELAGRLPRPLPAVPPAPSSGARPQRPEPAPERTER
jgi:REP element-mobilizing transposase RayT